MSLPTHAAFNPRSKVPASGKVVEFTRPPARRLIGELLWAGRDVVLSSLQELVRLEVGWDGYDAPPVSLDNAYFALEVLKTVCNSNTHPPQIVPGSLGDLQIEWHTSRGSIELHIRRPFDVLACRTTANGAHEEMTVTNDFLKVASWVSELSGMTDATSTAAA